MAAGAKWAQQNGLETVLTAFDIHIELLKAEALKAADEIAHLLESYAKSNHPWKPDTGATDVSTRGFVEDAGEVINIYLTAGMDYDIFLELARDGKWAWLFPAILANQDRILQILILRLGSVV